MKVTGAILICNISKTPCQVLSQVWYKLEQLLLLQSFPTMKYSLLICRQGGFLPNPAQKNALDNFRNNLQHIDEIIDERNKQLEMEGKIPYSVLKPSRIPYGIAI